MPEVPHGRVRRGWDAIDATMPRWAAVVENRPVVAFVDHCLRGIGQIVFVNNPVSGAGILLAMYVSSAWVGVAVTVGVVVATATARALGMERDLTADGLYGFNGALVAGALAFLLSPAWSITVLVYGALGAAASTVLMAALVRVFIGGWGVPPVTLPFNLLTMGMLACTFAVTHLQGGSALTPRQLPLPEITTPVRSAAGAVGENDLAGLGHAVVHGLGTLVLSGQFASGVIVVVAMAVCSRILALMAVAGSLVGALTGLALGGDGVLIYTGFWGYNSFVCAVAIALLYVFTWRSVLFALGCAVVGAVLYGACSALLGPVGVPALTLPFCLATLMFLLAGRSASGLVAVPLDRLSTPEQHRIRRREELEAAPGGARTTGVPD
ncbi:urea transporter [Pseudonocardia sp. ICBG162]|uniref:urea transporter n=1 Tax=Pseudonocardia sp. ICBG162 TaxID=2846761 RepID=UPI001CF6D433|nr:urea transporter [Pseudonocardia sp. ICBG162]